MNCLSCCDLRIQRVNHIRIVYFFPLLARNSHCSSPCLFGELPALTNLDFVVNVANILYLLLIVRLTLKMETEYQKLW